MFNGAIQSTGPRYCPSIEDKINRFKDKSQHQIFVEPEGWNTVEVYVNGFSTSLPDEIQYKALKSVKGFESVKFLDQDTLSNMIISHQLSYTIPWKPKEFKTFFCWSN